MEFAIIRMWRDPLTGEMRREELDLMPVPEGVTAQEVLATWHLRRYGSLAHRPSRGTYVSELRSEDNVLLCIVQPA